MTIPESLASEMGVLRDLRSAYEGRGMRFTINPPPDAAPGFLVGYRPDAVAIGPDGTGVVFEVRSYRTPKTLAEIDELKRRVSAQDGWQLEVIYINPSTDDTNDIAKPTDEQIDFRLGEVEKLRQAGYHEAAFLVAWAVLESLARLVAPASSAVMARSLSAVQIVQRLAELGYLENEEASELRALAKLRNAITHGDLSVTVSSEKVAMFIEQLKVLRSEIFGLTERQSGA